MSTHRMVAVMDASSGLHLTLAQFAVLMVLANRENSKRGTCFGSATKVGKIAHVERKAAERAFRDLATKGYIKNWLLRRVYHFAFSEKYFPLKKYHPGREPGDNEWVLWGREQVPRAPIHGALKSDKPETERVPRAPIHGALKPATGALKPATGALHTTNLEPTWNESGKESGTDQISAAQINFTSPISDGDNGENKCEGKGDVSPTVNPDPTWLEAERELMLQVGGDRSPATIVPSPHFTGEEDKGPAAVGSRPHLIGDKGPAGIIVDSPTTNHKTSPPSSPPEPRHPLSIKFGDFLGAGAPLGKISLAWDEIAVALCAKYPDVDLLDVLVYIQSPTSDGFWAQRLLERIKAPFDFFAANIEKILADYGRYQALAKLESQRATNKKKEGPHGNRPDDSTNSPRPQPAVRHYRP